MIYIETPRLLLRDWQEEDLNPFSEMNQDPLVMEFFLKKLAEACLKYAGEHLPFTTVYSFTSLPNKRSERVMQKIGMQKVKEFPHPSVPGGHPLKEHVLYGITLSDRHKSLP